MSSPPPNLRQRGGKKNVAVKDPQTISPPLKLSPHKKAVAKPAGQWDYKAALVILTLLAFATRFASISYPDEVVFDEVHFGKVSWCFQLHFHVWQTPQKNAAISSIG